MIAEVLLLLFLLAVFCGSGLVAWCLVLPPRRDSRGDDWELHGPSRCRFIGEDMPGAGMELPNLEDRPEAVRQP